MANDDEKVTNEDVERDVPYFKSDLEDIDFAVYNFLDDFMDVNVKTNKGFKKVPVIWSGSERSQNIKSQNIERDSLELSGESLQNFGKFECNYVFDKNKFLLNN